MSPTLHRWHMSVLCENSICWIWEPQTCPEWYFDVENGPRRSVWLRKLILLLIPSGGVVDGHSQRNLIRKHPCQGERWILDWGGWGWGWGRALRTHCPQIISQHQMEGQLGHSHNIEILYFYPFSLSSTWIKPVYWVLSAVSVIGIRCINSSSYIPYTMKIKYWKRAFWELYCPIEIIILWAHHIVFNATHIHLNNNH